MSLQDTKVFTQKEKMFRIILFASVCVSISLALTRIIRPRYTHPFDLPYHWAPVSGKDLQCSPKLADEISSTCREAPMTFYRISPSSTVHSEAQGYICYGLTYTSHCFTYFFGNKHKDQTISHFKPKLVDCQSAIREFEEGETNSKYIPRFPAYKCSWLKGEDSTSDFVLVKEKKVHFDPYREAFISAEFPGGECKEKTCEMIHDGTYWLDKKDDPICPKLEPIAGNLYHSNEGLCGLMLVGHAYETLEGTCKLEYCGREGALTSGGSWYYWAGMSEFPFCDKSRLIEKSTETSENLEQDIEFKIDLERELCFNTRQDIINSGKISPDQLALFRYPYEGEQWAYRLNRGEIERAWVHYRAIERFSTDGNTLAIGFLRNGTELRWTNWLSRNGSLIKDGINGVFKNSKGRIVIPDKEFSDELYNEELTLEQTLTLIKHPVLVIISNKTEDPDSNESRDDEEDSSFMVEFGGLSDTLKSVIIIAVLTVAVFLFIIFLLCIIKCIKKITKTSESQRPREEIPLNLKRLDYW